MILRRSTGDPLRTTGILQMPASGVVFATIERPWIENPNGPGGKSRESCVPPGLYTVIPHHSVHFPNTYALVNHKLGVYYQPDDVPEGQKWGRTAILIHVANRVRDVIGCIGIGLEHGKLESEPAVLKSTLAMRQLDTMLNRQKHQLEITI